MAKLTGIRRGVKYYATTFYSDELVIYKLDEATRIIQVSLSLSPLIQIQRRGRRRTATPPSTVHTTTLPVLTITKIAFIKM